MEAARGHGNAIADAQLGILPIDHANLRIIDDSRLTVGQQSGGGGARQREAVITCAEMRKRIQLQAAVARIRIRVVGIVRAVVRAVIGRSRRSVRRKGQRRAGAGIDSQIADAIAPRLKNRELNNYLSLGLIDVAYDFFGEHHFIRRIADDDGVLRVELLHAPQIEQLPQPVYDFRQVLRKDRILQVDRADDLFLVVAPLLSLVRRHKDDVVGYRFPESLGLERDNVQRLFEGYIGQFRGNSPGREVWIENHGQPSQLGDGVEDHPRIVGHLQIDGRAREGLQLRRARHGFGPFLARSSRRGGILRALGRKGIHRILYFLLRDGTRGIDHQGFLKLG